MQTYTKASEGSRLQAFCDAVIEVAGEEGFQQIQAAYGGLSVYVPIEPTETNWLSSCLGWDIAKKIGRALAVLDADGNPIAIQHLMIPMGSQGGAGQRRAELDRLLLEEGAKSVREIAAQLRVNERTVWRRKSELVAAGKLKKRPGRGYVLPDRNGAGAARV